jgi:sporulation protein YlmC with PRC-barrel domain
MRLSDESLRGRTVISADGTAIGSILELFIDSVEWRVESIQVELRKDVADRIGANRSVFHRGTIELPIRFVQSVSDTLVLNVDVDQLRTARSTPPAERSPQPTD